MPEGFFYTCLLDKQAVTGLTPTPTLKVQYGRVQKLNSRFILEGTKMSFVYHRLNVGALVSAWFRLTAKTTNRLWCQA